MDPAYPPAGRGSIPLDETPIADPAKSLVLQPSPSAAHQERLTRRAPDVAELFHVNSALSPSSPRNRPLDPAEAAEARDWFHGSAFDPKPEDWDPAEALRRGAVRSADDPAAAWGLELPAALGPDGPELLYGTDLLLLAEDRLLRWFPGRRWLWTQARVGAERREQLLDCLLPGPPRRSGGCLLFVVAVPSRYTALQGPRGYRRTLFQAGRLADRLARAVAAGPVGAAPEPVLDFHDDRLNDLLGLDGLEHAALAVLPLPPLAPATPPAGPAAPPPAAQHPAPDTHHGSGDRHDHH